MSQDKLEFQIYDFREKNIAVKDDSESEESRVPKFMIDVFGKTIDGKSVYCSVTDFTPYFYIEVPSNWTEYMVKNNLKKMRKWLKNKAPVYPTILRKGLLSVKLVRKKKATGFTNDKLFNFYALIFDNDISRKKYYRIFFPYPKERKRCIDCKNSLKRYCKNCDLSNTKKDGYRYNCVKCKADIRVKKCFDCNKLATYYIDNTTKNNLPKVLIPSISKKAIYYPTYEANFQAMLRCFHIRDIKGCGWVSVNLKDCILPDECKTFEDCNNDMIDKKSLCHYEFSIDYRKINSIKKNVNAPFIIASFDIECYSSRDGQFPQANIPDDKIIQIGTTYTRLGESIPFRQHIVCLNKTDKVNGVIVESYMNEKELIKGWIREINNSDCDIITGYNIFYFDEKYIYDRCDKILDLERIHYISKLDEYKSPFKEIKLASSALGENLLRFFDTPGRVHVDLMKELQKSHKLSSYKLDNVSSNFIRGKINNISKKNKYYHLECSQVNDIFIDDYIHIEISKGFVSDYIGRKYKVINIIDNTLVISTNINLLEEIKNSGDGKLFWSQAKDDVSAKDIFRLQMGNSADRAIVAKYCVKDCKLVNLLINKLDVITPQIHLANTNFVPLNYIFIRGQGIKLFSCVSYYYMKAEYLFPCMRPPQTLEKQSFEGAKVFDPIPSVSNEAVFVNDFSSLYPTIILQLNLSHETIVDNDNYDNMKDIEYYNAEYKDYKGEKQFVRVAKNKVGVIPTTIKTLLGERKKVKKKMKVEKDPVVKANLNGQQLALKITANSLYGQLGAMTSPIRCRKIARIITRNGQKNLILSKHYIEEDLPLIINGLKVAKENNDMKLYDSILNNAMKEKNDKVVKDITSYLEEVKNITMQPIIKYGDTDSAFACARYRRNVILKTNKDKNLKLWKKIMKFGYKLLYQFISSDYKSIFEKYGKKYYKNVNSLHIPNLYKVMEEPSHFKDKLPIEESIKKFIKRYFEKMYLPWLWTLQDLFLKEYNDLSYLDPKVYDEVINIKIFNVAQYMLETIDIYICDIDINIKNEIASMIQTFINKTLKGNWIQPYYTNNNMIGIRFYKKGSIICDKQSLDLSIKLGLIVGELIKNVMPEPQDFEYEKTFWPFIILTKKRYVGNKYEFDKNKYKLDFMGIVLKRRDNAPIVKEICEGIIMRLLNQVDKEKLAIYIKKCLNNMLRGKYNIKYFLTSKTLKLKSSYKDWTRIAHVVLADRIDKRDPGNAPQSGDRIEYAAVCVPERRGMLQGDRIETPAYIKEKNLIIDYNFYIKNQIMKPALQFLKLVLNNAESIFDTYLCKLTNESKRTVDIMNFVTSKKKDIDILDIFNERMANLS